MRAFSRVWMLDGRRKLEDIYVKMMRKTGRQFASRRNLSTGFAKVKLIPNGAKCKSGLADCTQLPPNFFEPTIFADDNHYQRQQPSYFCTLFEFAHLVQRLIQAHSICRQHVQRRYQSGGMDIGRGWPSGHSPIRTIRGQARYCG
jgi:hypothetical protein